MAKKPQNRKNLKNVNHQLSTVGLETSAYWVYYLLQFWELVNSDIVIEKRGYPFDRFLFG